jgi:hypothetical protein
MWNWNLKTVIIILIAFCIYGLYIVLGTNYLAERNINSFLSEYGWKTGKYYSVDKGTEPINVELSNKVSDLYKMIFEASEKIGLNPAEYDDKIVDMYHYKLTVKGVKEHLETDLWVHKNKVIAAYIMHVERNIRIKFWPVDTPYEQIVSDITKLYKDKQNNSAK